MLLNTYMGPPGAGGHPAAAAGAPGARQPYASDALATLLSQVGGRMLPGEQRLLVRPPQLSAADGALLSNLNTSLPPPAAGDAPARRLLAALLAAQPGGGTGGRGAGAPAAPGASWRAVAAGLPGSRGAGGAAAPMLTVSGLGGWGWGGAGGQGNGFSLGAGGGGGGVAGISQAAMDDFRRLLREAPPFAGECCPPRR